MVTAGWVVVAIGVFVGGILLLNAFFAGALQGTALAAMACASAILPFCMARALQAREDRDRLKLILKVLASIANSLDRIEAQAPKNTDENHREVN